MRGAKFQFGMSMQAANQALKEMENRECLDRSQVAKTRCYWAGQLDTPQASPVLDEARISRRFITGNQLETVISKTGLGLVD